MKTMIKQKFRTIAASTMAMTLLGVGNLLADEEGHDHAGHAGEAHADHKEVKAGPNGGRILVKVEPHLEFFLMEDRKVQITALDKDGKAKPIGDQSIRITGGDRSNPTRMTFAKKGEVLVSDIAFPEGNHLPVVVQIKVTPDAKTVIEKFNLDLSDCPTCEHAEYACTCGH